MAALFYLALDLCSVVEGKLGCSVRKNQQEEPVIRGLDVGNVDSLVSLRPPRNMRRLRAEKLKISSHVSKYGRRISHAMTSVKTIASPAANRRREATSGRSAPETLRAIGRRAAHSMPHDGYSTADEIQEDLESLLHKFIGRPRL